LFALVIFLNAKNLARNPGNKVARSATPPRCVKASEAFVIPAGKTHGARNPGAVPLRFVGVYVVEKGKPLATAAK
jgi:mannose-6-phosphate isomerase-like protein (cupin superfamily)